jgi:tripartite-type tricarboxylate transporter receptor subunit TctC
MKLARRRFLHLAAGAAALVIVSRVARAQSYPSRPVHLVVGFPAGGGTDTIARLLAQSLSERLGQPFVIENRPGAGTNIGTEAVVRAPADGYTLLYVTAANAINATLYDKLNFNFIRDIAPVAGIVRLASVMVVHPSFPAKTIPEFIAYAKANPGKINMASAGTGNSSHVSGELFKMLSGIDMVHVPYRGGAPALQDLIGGQVHVMFDAIGNSLEHIRQGTLRPLGVTTAQRSDALPDVPAIDEFVPGYETSVWYGIGVPRNTPAEIVERLNKEINSALADPRMKARLADMGGTIITGSPADFGALIAAETEKWAKVVKFSGAKPD